MTPPKKIYLPDHQMYCEGYAVKTKHHSLEYISVDHLKEWIDQQAEKNHESVGALSVLVKLETFLNSEE